MLRFLRSGSKRTKTIWWALTVITVVTFLGGFVFLFGAGLDMGGSSARMRGAVGTVDGQSITRTDFQNAVADQRAAYARRLGSDPGERDERALENQAWQTLVTQRLMAEQARRVGLKAWDPEVVLTLQTSPPAPILNSPAFVTNGKFDPTKYQAALRDPNNNWSAFEDLIRGQLPIRKLEERMLSSIKLSEPELREAFRDRFEQVSGEVAAVGPDMTLKVPPPTQADLDRVYQENRGRFTTGPRVQLEVLLVPKKFNDEDVRTARQLAQSLVDRARKGEDFAQLAKDYSEGPNAAQGGAINRVFQPSEFGPALGPHMETLKPGDVSDPVQDGGQFMILKLLERVPDPVSATPSMRVAQIVVRVHPNEGTLAQQTEMLKTLRDRAATLKSLGRAATEKGLSTIKTNYYDTTNPPQELAAVPEVSEWGLNGKVHSVSPVFEGADDFAVAEVVMRHPGGPLPKEALADNLRQLAEFEARVNAAKPRADQLAALLAQGRSLDDAAKSVGAQVIALKGATRAQPDPRLQAVPEVVGALFGAPQGKVVGPLKGLTGWYFARADARTMPSDSLLANPQVRGQLSTEILTRRQQAFFAGWVGTMRMKAKVQDYRADMR